MKNKKLYLLLLWAASAITFVSFGMQKPKESQSIWGRFKEAIGSTPTQKLISLIDSDKKIKLEEVQPLIDAGADINIANKKGKTVLLKAFDAREIDYPLITYLKKAGATIENKNLIVDAARDNNLEKVKALLKLGLNANQKDADGFYPLYWAAVFKNIPLAVALLDAGANADTQQTKTGITALMKATENNDLRMVKLLLENDADPDITDINGKKAIDWDQLGEKEILKLFKDQ